MSDYSASWPDADLPRIDRTGVGGRIVLEASGGLRPGRLREIAATGVDFLSCGWLTHSAPAADLYEAFNITAQTVVKTVIEQLNDPLTHMIRNAVDHGIESPEDRSAAGKPPEGRIRLTAEQHGSRIVVQLSDDGRGIDRDRVHQTAVAKNLIAPDADLSDEEIDNLIFLPGFSTAEQISSISGRGVGMDVVRSNIEKLGGTVKLDSVVGEGTSVLLQLPLTLAIIPSLIVGVASQRYAIPQVNVEEFVWKMNIL